MTSTPPADTAAVRDTTSALDALPPLRDVIAAAGLDARKSLGQHFLLDLNLTRRIAKLAEGENGVAGRTVIEVGPGPGGLTRGLLAGPAARVIAIERDGRAVQALQPLIDACPGRFSIIEADALAMDPGTLLDAVGDDGRCWIASNLPYNISTQLTVQWAERPERIAGMVLMYQKEVADRLTARPGGKDYGRLSVLAQWRFSIYKGFDIGPRAFTPPPKVTSTVLVFETRPEPLAPAELKALSTVTAAAFGQRRKMLRQSLKALGNAEDLLAAAGIDPTRRAETVSVEGFCALARAFADRRQAGDGER